MSNEVTPTTRDMEEAKKIVENSPECSECKAITVRSGDMVKCLNCGHERNWFVSQQHRIAQALAARNPPPGHVRLSDEIERLEKSLRTAVEEIKCGRDAWNKELLMWDHDKQEKEDRHLPLRWERAEAATDADPILRDLMREGE